MVKNNEWTVYQQRGHGEIAKENIEPPLPPRRVRLMRRYIDSTNTHVIAMYVGGKPDNLNIDSEQWPWQHIGFFKPAKAQELALAYLRMSL